MSAGMFSYVFTCHLKQQSLPYRCAMIVFHGIHEQEETNIFLWHYNEALIPATFFEQKPSVIMGVLFLFLVLPRKTADSPLLNETQSIVTIQLCT